MKAVFFETHGELDVLHYGTVADPVAAAGQAVVRVKACALNYLDLWVRRGWPGLKLEMPHWCGADVAGEICELGPRVAGWAVGQRVVIDPGIRRRSPCVDIAIDRSQTDWPREVLKAHGLTLWFGVFA